MNINETKLNITLNEKQSARQNLVRRIISSGNTDFSKVTEIETDNLLKNLQALDGFLNPNTQEAIPAIPPKVEMLFGGMIRVPLSERQSLRYRYLNVLMDEKLIKLSELSELETKAMLRCVGMMVDFVLGDDEVEKAINGESVQWVEAKPIINGERKPNYVYSRGGGHSPSNSGNQSYQ